MFFFQAGISKTGKSYHITNEETTHLVKRGWYNIKSGEKKTLKKPIYSLKLSIRRSGGPGIWAVMLCRCLMIQVTFKGILESLIHTRDSGLKPAPRNSTLQCFFHIMRTFWGSLFHYNDSSSQIKNQDPALHAESKFIPLPLKTGLLPVFWLDSFIFCAVTWRKDTVLKFFKTICKRGTSTQVIYMTSYKIGTTALILI